MMSQERKQIIIAIDAADLFKVIEYGNVKFKHDLPKDIIYRNCKYNFQSNEILFLVEHESFSPLHDGMLAPVVRIKWDD